MYTLKRILKNINEYYIIYDNDLLLWKPKEIYYNSNLILKGNITNLYANNQTIIYSINYKDFYLYNLLEKENKLLTLDCDGFEQFINDDYAVFFKNSKDFLNNYISLINLQTLKKEWTIKSYFGNGKIFNDAIFAVCKGGKICKISLTTPQTPLWQFDLSQLGTYYNTWDKKDENYRVEKFIGIYNEILYVALNLYSETIIAIDIKTGKLLNQWKNIPFTLGANLDTEQKQIFGLIKKEFWQINLETAEFTKTNIHPVLQNIEFENVRDQVNIPITDTHYVIKLQTPIDTSNSNRIYDGLALFNKHTQQIDWHYLFGNETWLASNEPKITKDKIFQLSNEGNLFIFEKTSNENV